MRLTLRLRTNGDIIIWRGKRYGWMKWGYVSVLGNMWEIDPWTGTNIERRRAR
jgi:hypothetical protein